MLSHVREGTLDLHFVLDTKERERKEEKRENWLRSYEDIACRPCLLICDLFIKMSIILISFGNSSAHQQKSNVHQEAIGTGTPVFPSSAIPFVGSSLLSG